MPLPFKKYKCEVIYENPYVEFHPSLKIKRIQRTNNIFEMTITMSIRVTWQYIDDGILLRNIGKHDKT